MVKFVFGPAAGMAAGLHYFETTIFTIVGMMVTVLIIIFFGSKARQHIISRFFNYRKKFTKRNRRFVYLWKRYGIFGVSFLTPLVLTPIGGALLITAIGAPKAKVIVYMLISAIFWGVVVSKVVYTFGTLIS